MALRFKTFVQILMAVLALGIGLPQPICAAGTPQVAKSCCCVANAVCKCHPDKQDKDSCSLVQAQACDKQTPVRTSLVRVSQGHALLCSIPSAEVKNPFLVTVVHQQNSNASPPFGGSSPQAVLCLWLI